MADTNSLTLAFAGGRSIAWRLSDQQMITVAQTLVQVLGPAEEVENDGKH